MTSTSLRKRTPRRLTSFKQGKIDGGWLPEPWASRLVQEGGGKVLVNEKDLWPPGSSSRRISSCRRPSSTNTLTKSRHCSRASSRLLDTVNANPAKAKTDVNAALKTLTGKALDDTVLARSWDNLKITVDPIATSLKTDLDHAVDVGISKPADLNGIYDLSILNSILTASGKAPVQAGTRKAVTPMSNQTVTSTDVRVSVDMPPDTTPIAVQPLIA